MNTKVRLFLWGCLGLIAGFTLVREPAPVSHSIISPQPNQLISMGITPALEQMRHGVVFIDARQLSPDDLPIPGALRDGKNHIVSNHKNRVIVIGDETAAQKLQSKLQVVGWVPAWTLKRDVHIPAEWEISPTQLQNSDMRVLDVREKYEWARSSVPGSEQVSMFDLANEMRDKKQPVAVFCETGHRSAFWVKKLRADGFKNVLSVRGGWLDWKAEKRPLRGADEKL